MQKNHQLIKKPICLALQGGGAYGAYSWGILDKLLEDNRLDIEAISATSAGSVNAVILAHGLIKGGNEGAREALNDFWTSISEYGSYLSPIRQMLPENLASFDVTAYSTFETFDNFCHAVSPYLFNPFNFNILKIILQNKVDFELLKKETSIQLFLCATNVKTGKLKVFENAELSIDAVLASACLPHLNHAVNIDDEYYWDGGYIGNPPIFPLIYKSKINDILIIHNNPIVRDSVPVTSHEIDNRMNEISFNSSLMRELRAIHFVTTLITDGMIKSEFKDYVRLKLVHIIRSDAAMNQFSLIDKYKWHLEFLLKLRDLGRKNATNWLESNCQDVGIKSTIDFNEFL
ncbi:MAG: hypothetical protein A3E85_02665 [Gammaproteobacteria bacterium RIFCSPHIGHO2_12_FULL_45_12]|nr:MAG: hypothetical protein A3E85_02665 [Gammaproteobacteria bacterium RIFCSPHIGHO2_12_FULL_45_12]